MGGAAKLVKAPPIEMLTNKTPMVRYINFVELVFEKMVSRSKKAAKVIAAGSVINEPKMGTALRVTK